MGAAPTGTGCRPYGDGGGVPPLRGRGAAPTGTGVPPLRGRGAQYLRSGGGPATPRLLSYPTPRGGGVGVWRRALHFLRGLGLRLTMWKRATSRWLLVIY